MTRREWLQEKRRMREACTKKKQPHPCRHQDPEDELFGVTAEKSLVMHNEEMS